MRAPTLTIMLLLLSCAVAQAGVFPYAYREEVLPNGLTCVLVPLDNPGLVAYITIVRTGSRDEVEPGHTGFAHFFEHMMFQGTVKYPADVYNRIHVEMGANENAFTSDDLTCYYQIFARPHLEKIMELEADRFMNLKYAKQAFQREAKAILGEYNKSASNPFFQLEEKFFDTAFEAHTYKHTTMGFLKDIEDMPNQYDYSLQFFDRFYRPGNCIIVIAGDIDAGTTLTLLKKYYSSWKPGTYTAAYPKEPEQKGARSCNIDYVGDTLPLLWMGYTGPAFDPASKDTASLILIGSLLFGETSALYQDLVLKEQLVDSVDGQIDPHRDAYPFLITARLKRASDLPAVRTRIEAAIESARNEVVAEARLNDVKLNMKYGFLMGLNSTRGVAMNLITLLQLAGHMSAIDTYYATIDSITPADLQATARACFVADRLTVATLTAGGR